VRQSQWSMRVVSEEGPIHRAKSSGSVWARMSCAGVAAKSRQMWTAGTVGSASMAASL
jgi:hypothetical protein